jgi:hypothetical protein
LLDVHPDVDHDRSVCTLVGTADELEGAGATLAAARERNGGFPGVRAPGSTRPHRRLRRVARARAAPGGRMTRAEQLATTLVVDADAAGLLARVAAGIARRPVEANA